MICLYVSAIVVPHTPEHTLLQNHTLPTLIDWPIASSPLLDYPLPKCGRWMYRCHRMISRCDYLERTQLLMGLYLSQAQFKIEIKSVFKNVSCVNL